MRVAHRLRDSFKHSRQVRLNRRSGEELLPGIPSGSAQACGRVVRRLAAPRASTPSDLDTHPGRRSGNQPHSGSEALLPGSHRERIRTSGSRPPGGGRVRARHTPSDVASRAQPTELGPNLAIREPDYTDQLRFSAVVRPRAYVSAMTWLRVRVPVDLDAKACPCAVEVDNEATEERLLSAYEEPELAVPHGRPEAGFGSGGGVAGFAAWRRSSGGIR